MENTTENKIIIRSLIYKFMERTGYQGVAFLVQIILARLLSPSDYGIISMLTIFITVSQVFVQSGLNTALIQKKEADEEDFSSVFYISLTVAIILYGLLFVASPIISEFYNMPELKNVLRVLALVLIPGAYNSIQNAKIAREMQFKKLMYSTMGAVCISGIVGIGLAFTGAGVWALVAQQIVNQLAICLILFKVVKWHPCLKYSFYKVKTLFDFGWKLLCSSLIDTIYTNLQSLVIGKKYNATMLGYFNRGKQFPQLLVENINGSIQSIMLPTLSRHQDDKERMKAMMRKSIVTSSFVLLPILVGLAVVAKPLVSIVLTDKWLPCVPYIWIYCFNYAFMPIHTANLQAINAQGRSDEFLRLELIKKSYGIIILFISVVCFESPIAIALGMSCTTIISCFVNAQPNKRMLNYRYIEQLKDILPSAVLAFVMGGVVYGISYLQLSDFVTIILQVLVGILIYISLAKVCKIEAYEYMISVLGKFRKK